MNTENKSFYTPTEYEKKYGDILFMLKCESIEISILC